MTEKRKSKTAMIQELKEKEQQLVLGYDVKHSNITNLIGSIVLFKHRKHWVLQDMYDCLYENINNRIEEYNTTEWKTLNESHKFIITANGIKFIHINFKRQFIERYGGVEEYNEQLKLIKKMEFIEVNEEQKAKVVKFCEAKRKENEENRIEYTEYLLSPEWEEIKKQMKARYGNKCELCGSTQDLEVHHLHYRNLGHEDLRDLLLLCHDCHINRIHYDKVNEQDDLKLKL